MKTTAIVFTFPLLAISLLPYQNSIDESTQAPIGGNFPMNLVNISCDEGGLRIPSVDTGNYYASSMAILPSAVRLDMPIPGDQGIQASCAAWAIVYGAGNYYMHLTTGKPYSDSGNLTPGFIYNQLSKGKCRITTVLDNLYLFKNDGSCSMGTMPYNANDCFTQPDNTQLCSAANHKIKGWQKIDPYNLTLLKTALSQKRPIIFSIILDEGFDKITAPFTWKKRYGHLEQTHTMVIAGYDDRKMPSWL